MERFCGTLAGVAKSKVSNNRNISNTLTMLEQRNSLIYVIDCGTTSPNSSDEDSDGNILLSNFLAKRLQNARPPDTENPNPKLAPTVDVLSFTGPSRI